MPAPDDVPGRHLPAIQPYYPTTFLERGVAVPFTTPLLDGSRARPAVRAGLELIVPNPSGGRGVYILPWGGVCDLCQPTVHDTCLNQKIAELHGVTPGAIRRAARDLAIEGLAGDAAMIAARAMGETDRGDRLLNNFLLLMALIDEVEPNRQAPPELNYDRTLELEDYARRAVARIAPRIGQPADAVAAALETLADVLYGVGVHGQAALSRVPRLLQMLRQVRAEIAAWGARHHVDEVAAYAEMVGSVADVTLDCAAITLRAAQGLSTDMVGLLDQWVNDPQSVARLAARPEWLLDGWERICLVWTLAADDAARRSALVEMAQLVPLLPREAADWVGMTLDTDQPLSFRRTVRLNEDWRTGATVFDLIARNEQLRALAA